MSRHLEVLLTKGAVSAEEILMELAAAQGRGGIMQNSVERSKKRN